MGRKRYGRPVPPPVTSPRVPDVVHDKGVKLSRAERCALKEEQTDLFLHGKQSFGTKVLTVSQRVASYETGKEGNR